MTATAMASRVGAVSSRRCRCSRAHCHFCSRAASSMVGSGSGGSSGASSGFSRSRAGMRSRSHWAAADRRSLKGTRLRQDAVLVVLLRNGPGLVRVLLLLPEAAAQPVQGVLPGRFVVRAILRLRNRLRFRFGFWLWLFFRLLFRFGGRFRLRLRFGDRFGDGLRFRGRLRLRVPSGPTRAEFVQNVVYGEVPLRRAWAACLRYAW